MLGRICLTLSAGMAIVGPFLFDFNETHVKNPRWPPHAKFHNGQTMSMGLALGLAALYYSHRPAPKALKADHIFTAAVFASLYWITGLSAILYPGSKAIDPEFGEGFPQLYVFTAMAVISWVGYWLEIRSLSAVEKTA